MSNRQFGVLCGIGVCVMLLQCGYLFLQWQTISLQREILQKGQDVNVTFGNARYRSYSFGSPDLIIENRP